MLTEGKSEKLFKIYQSANAWKIIYQFILPSILTALPAGIFVFVDQVLMMKLIPSNSHFSETRLFGQTWTEICEFASKNNLPIYRAGDIIKSAIVLSMPLTLLFEICPYLISTGAMAIYARKLAAKDFKGLKKVFNSSFWFSLFLGTFLCAVLCALAATIPFFTTASKANFPPGIASDKLDDYKDYLKKVDKLSVNYAVTYLQIISVSLIFSTMQSTLSLLLRVESKSTFPILSAVIANFINIGLDYIFLSYTGYGMNAAALASVIGYISSLVILFGYIFYASQKDLLHFSYKDIRLNKTIDWKLFLEIMKISSPIFIVSLFYSINIAVFVPVFGNTLNRISDHLQALRGHLYYQNLFGCTQPIVTLVFSGMNGIFDGTRGISNFYYENVNISQKKIQKLFHLTTVVSLLYAFITFMLVYLTEDFFYNVLQVNSSKNDFHEWVLLVTAEVPTFSLAIPALSYFQSSNRNLYSSICAVVQLIVFLIVLFVLRGICINESKSNFIGREVAMHSLAALMQMTIWIASLISSAMIYLIGLLYVLVYDKKQRLKRQVHLH